MGVPQSFSADGGSRNGDGDSDVPMADVQTALRACRAARQDEEALFSSAALPPPPPGSEAAAAAADRAADAARRRVLCIAAFSPAPLRRRIVTACALQPAAAVPPPAPAPASQTPQRGSSAAETASLFSRIVATDVLSATRGAEASESRAAALAFPITADCLCTAVGPVRCLEGAFRAYVHGHADVLLALAMLRGGNVTGPARAFCDALGPARCNLVMRGDELEPGVVDAGRAVAGHEAVSVLWQVRKRGERALEGCPRQTSPALPPLLQVLRGHPILVSDARLQLDGSAQNASFAGVPGGPAALRTLDAILDTLRTAHLTEAPRGDGILPALRPEPLAASTSLRAALARLDEASGGASGSGPTAVDARLHAVLAGWTNVTLRGLLSAAGVAVLPIRPAGNGSLLLSFSVVSAPDAAAGGAAGSKTTDWLAGSVDLEQCRGETGGSSAQCKLRLARGGRGGGAPQRHPILNHGGLGVYPLDSRGAGVGALGPRVVAFDRDSIYAYLASAADVAARAQLLLAPGIPVAPPPAPEPPPSVVRLGLCVPARSHLTRASCLDLDGTCSLVRSGESAREYAARLRKPAAAGGVGGGSENVAELPPRKGDMTDEEKQMAVGGASSMQATQARARAAAKGQLSEAEKAAAAATPGGVSAEQGMAYDAAVASGAIDASADPLDTALAMTRKKAGIKPLLGTGEDAADGAASQAAAAALAAVFPASASGPRPPDAAEMDAAVAHSRAECEGFRATGSGAAGTWTPSNRWLPFLHATAMGAGVRSLELRALDAMLRSRLADANALVPAERLELPVPAPLALDAVGVLVRGRPCNASGDECAETAAQPADGAAADRLGVLRSSTGAYIVDAAPSGGRVVLPGVWPRQGAADAGAIAALVARVSFNGSSLAHAAPAAALNGGCAQPPGLYQGDPAVMVWAVQGCRALLARPWDVLIAALTGAIPAEGACVLSPGGCSLGAAVALDTARGGITPPPSASVATLRAMSEVLARSGASSMAFTRAIALRWYVAHDAGNEGEEDLTMGDDHTNVGHGKMGFLSETDGRWPWWECVPRPEDGGGCDGDESGGGDDDDGDDEEDDPDGDDGDDEGPDDGDPNESEGPPACDPSTGEGCECDAPEPADSDLVCSPKTHRKTPRRISNTKVKRKLKKKNKKKKVKSKKKSKKGSVKKPKVRCRSVVPSRRLTHTTAQCASLPTEMRPES